MRNISLRNSIIICKFAPYYIMDGKKGFAAFNKKQQH